MPILLPFESRIYTVFDRVPFGVERENTEEARQIEFEVISWNFLTLIS